MSHKDHLLASTAILAALRYRSYELFVTGRVPNVTIARHVMYRFVLSRMIIEVVAYYAFDLVTGRSYPLAETREEAVLHVVFPSVIAT